MAKPTHPELEAHYAKMDALPSRTLCALCSWVYEGTAVEGREKSIQHRSQAHPELVVNRRKRGGHLQSFRQPKLDKKEMEEIYAERDKRAFLLGIDLGDAKS